MAGAVSSAKPAPFLRPLDTLDRGVLLAESALSVVIVLIMVLFAIVEIVGRMAKLTHPVLSSASDVLMSGALWAAFLGASFATRGRKHLAIDVVGRILPERGRRVVVAIAATMGSVVAFVISKGVFEALVHRRHEVLQEIEQLRAAGTMSGAPSRMFEFHFVIAGGFLLIALRLLLHGFHEFVSASRGDVGPPSKPHAVDELEESPEVGLHGHAPISEANGAEIVIALVTLVVMLASTRGTTVLSWLAVAVFFAALSIGIPALVRYRKHKSFAPTVKRDPPPEVRWAAKDLVVGAIGVVAVLALASYGAAHITQVPTKVGIAFFALMAFIGAPLFTFLGGMALFLWSHGSQAVPPTTLANAVEDVFGTHFAQFSVLPTIPIFTLAGYLMSESKTPQRLVRLARAFLGWAPGGLAIVCIFASAFFTVFSGASGITIVAIGGLLFPALIKDKYPEKFSLGMVTTGGALGITFPPCLPLIVYGIVAGIQEVPRGHERPELKGFLVAGILPGLFIIFLLSIYSMVIGKVAKVPRSKFDLKEALAATWDAKWELLLPVFLLGGLASGVFNPSQAAAFTAFYVLIIEVFIYKDLSLTKDIPRIIPESMLLVGAIFVKLCAATILVGYFVQAHTADDLFDYLVCGQPAQEYMRHNMAVSTCREAVEALARTGQSAGGIIDSKISFLIALNVFLLVVGMLMDIFSAIVVVVPLISGIAMHFEINPYHLGIVFLFNLEIGYLMPPMGLNLFIAAFRFNRPVPDLYRMVLPFIGLFAIALMVTTYVPQLSLALLPKPRTATVHAGPSAGGPSALPSGSSAAPSAGANANCDVPGEDESFEAFNARCSGGGGASAAPSAAPSAEDCDVPRDTETFEEFQRRCTPSTPSAEPGASAEPSASAAPSAEPSASAAPNANGSAAAPSAGATASASAGGGG